MKSIKPFVVSIASSDDTQWLSCIVGNVGAMFREGRGMRGINYDICGSAVSILIVCFESVMSPESVISVRR